MTKIVFSGAAPSETATLLISLAHHFSDLGYQVGVVPHADNLDSQIQAEDQIEKTLSCDKPALILCNGGTMDHTQITNHESPDESQITNHYSLDDSQITNHYSLVNNVVNLRDARYDAVILVNPDGATISAWTGHPHLRIVDNSHFSIINSQVRHILGIPQPIEVERKYLVDRVGRIPYSNVVEIEQTYLLPVDGKKSRIRRRGQNGQYIYFITTKTRLADDRSIEEEERISEERYKELLAFADPAKRTVRKLRTCFVWENQYFELDEFIEPKIDHLLLEIEDAESPDDVIFPPFLKIIKDVTDDPAYKNSNMAIIK